MSLILNNGSKIEILYVWNSSRALNSQSAGDYRYQSQESSTVLGIFVQSGLPLINISSLKSDLQSLSKLQEGTGELEPSPLELTRLCQRALAIS